MSTCTEGKCVGRPKSRNEGTTSIRLPDDLVAQARAIAGLRNESIVEVLVAILRKPLSEQYNEAIRLAAEGLPRIKQQKKTEGPTPKGSE